MCRYVKGSKKRKLGRKNGLVAWIAGILSVVMLLGSFSFAIASEAKNKTIRIGYVDFDNFIVEENGHFSGYAVEYLNKISEYTGWDYEYVYGTWEESLNNLEEGKIDLIVQAQKTPEREERFLFSEYSMGYESSDLYVREDDDRFYYDDIEHFDGMVVGELESSFQNETFAEYAKKNDFTYSVVYFGNMKETFEALDEGKVDGVVSGGLSVKEGYKLVSQYSSDPFYAITAKGRHEIMDPLNRAIETIMKNNPYYAANLNEKYYGTQYQKTVPSLTRQEAEYIAKLGRIVVAQLESGLPYYDEQEENGIQKDILDQISKMSGLQFDVRPISRCRGKKVQLYCGVLTSAQCLVEEGYYVSDPVYKSQFVLVGKKNISITPNKSVIIGVVKQNGMVNYDFSKSFPKARIRQYPTVQQCLTAVNDEMVDFAYLDSNSAAKSVRKDYSQKLSLLTAYTFENNLEIMFPRDTDPLLVSIINKCIVCLDKDNLTNLIMDYSIEEQKEFSVEQFLYYYKTQIIILGFLVIFVIYLCYIIFQNRKAHELELEQSNNRLKEVNETLEKVSMAKTDFLSNMSHEIRTPMNAIMGMTALAMNEADPGKTIGETGINDYLKDIRTSTEYLLGIVNDILDMNRIESGRIELNPEWISPKKTVQVCVNMVEKQMKEKNIRFVYVDSFEENDRFYYYLDLTRTQQVIMNLLNNAYKYTGSGGVVTLMTKIQRGCDGFGEDEIIVSDTGCGMSEEFMERIFQPFEQERNIYSDLFPGTGLGLALVKRILTRMGGRITVESKLNVGTTFHVFIPYEYRIMEETNEKRMEKLDEEKVDEILKGKRVLLVEDQELNRKISRKILEKKNMLVDIAVDGEKAVGIFENSPAGTYDVILMDIRMPVMDGLEATRRIRALKKEDAQRIPIIAMTANAFATDVQNCMEAGMNAHLAKPIHPEEVFYTLAKYLA